MKNLAALIGAVLYGGHHAQAFYLPGVAPKSFSVGDAVELKVNALTSISNPYPLEYYHLPFCKPTGGAQMKNENLGEFLTGDRIESSPYKIRMRVDSYCEQVCVSNLGQEIPTPTPLKADKNKKERIRWRKMSKTIYGVKRNYHNNWIVDNLPAASKIEFEDDVSSKQTAIRYSQGFPIGFTDSESKKLYINNHVNIELQYHAVEAESDKFRVVGFTVEPFSIKHEFEATKDMKEKDFQTSTEQTIKDPILSCQKGTTSMHTDFKMVKNSNSQLAEGPVLFTYDVLWSENKELNWASRWDVYLKVHNEYPEKIHWLSISNSMVIVIILSAMIAAILVRNLRRDVARYSSLPIDEERAEDMEEFGWKLVHADVFRAPAYPMLFAVFCGSGMQILFMSLFTIVFACMGLLNPSHRGYLMITLLLLYVFMGFVAGYTTACMYKTFKGKSQQKATTLVAFGFPGIAFTVFFILNLFTIAQRNGDAVPFHTMLTLVVLWFGISTPLVFYGAYIGYKKETIEFPVVTSSIPRQIPDQPWYMTPHAILMMGGMMPFGSCFLELYFIMSSVWTHQYYYVFGILFVVFAILLMTCAEIAILINYFKLCNEDHQWWWSAFNSAGSTALYIFGYSIIYFKRLETNTFSSYVLYFGYMGLVSFMIFLMTGAVGLFSCLQFNKTIFGSIKID